MAHRKGRSEAFGALPLAGLCRRRMYTAVSRATHRVTALSQGPVTPLLPGLGG